ncbi:Inosine triphosphate pyrophosphatase [Dictyocoela muelleri]|nr:Inosine triphosphate pyrophosphatase [Dictyocoela muelleri]
MKIYFNTSNEYKYEEMKTIFPFKIHKCNIDVDEIQGDGSSICDKKAIDVSKKINDGMVITDDVSLEIAGLNGYPGPYIKSFLKIGFEKIEKIVELFGRSATVHCYLSLAQNGELKYTALGTLKGELIPPGKFDNGFGFDKIFKPNNSEFTFAEMGNDEKNKISHRALAAQEIFKYLNESGIIREIE